MPLCTKVKAESKIPNLLEFREDQLMKLNKSFIILKNYPKCNLEFDFSGLEKSTEGTLDLGTLLGSFLWSFMVH